MHYSNLKTEKKKRQQNSQIKMRTNKIFTTFSLYQSLYTDAMSTFNWI